MNVNSFTVKAGPDNKAKFQLIIPVQYCTNELFNEMTLVVLDKSNQQIVVKKAGLQFEVEFAGNVGDYHYTLILKKKSEEIDKREITISIVSGEDRKKESNFFIYRETLSHLKGKVLREVYCCYYQESEDLLVVANNKNIEIIRKSTLEVVDSLSGHSNSVKTIAYDPVNKTYLSAGDDKIIRWEPDAWSPQEVISDFHLGNRFACCLINENGKAYYVFSDLHSAFFTVCNLYDKNEIFQIAKKQSYNPSCVRYDPRSKLLLYGDVPENSVKVFSLSGNDFIKHKLMLESEVIDNITLVPDSNYFMTHSKNSEHLKIWALNEWKLVKKVPIKLQPFNNMAEIIINNKSSEMFIFYQSGIIDVYDWYGIGE